MCGNGTIGRISSASGDIVVLSVVVVVVVVVVVRGRPKDDTPPTMCVLFCAPFPKNIFVCGRKKKSLKTNNYI
tara:strand:+ start:380 stop:598 length:219 start_codon:yes stop_codon:yes gene_type:complete